MTPITAKKRSWRNNKIVIAGQWIFIIGCAIGTVFIFNAAVREDKRQEDFSAKYYLPAVQDYNSQHYKKAVPELQANLRAYPDDYEANFEMGLVLMKLDRNQEARVYFNNAEGSFLSHHGRFSTWEKYDAAQHEINKIDRMTAKK